MDSMDEIKETFFIECEDLLGELENGLLMVNEGYGDKETVNGVFRAVHSIKGGAGAFGLEDLVSFAHIFETTLDEVRSDRLELSGDVLKLFLQCSDMLADLVQAAQHDQPADGEASQALIQKLSELTVSNDTPAASDDIGAMPDLDLPGLDENGLDFQPIAFELDAIGTDDVEEGPTEYIIYFKPHKELYTSGNEPALLIRALCELGESKVVCNTNDLPMAQDLEAEDAYLSWEITLSTESPEDEIEEVFDFVEGICDLKIEKASKDASAPITPVDEGCDELGFTPQMLDIPPVDVEVPEMAMEPAIEVETPDEKIEPAEKTEDKATQVTKAATTKPTSDAPSSNATIRVNLERVDRMINLVGELVINQAMLSQRLSEAGLDRNSSVSSGVDEFKQLTREIQESVMAIRAQPVKSLFQRMSRIVREAANSTNKNVRLVTEGEMTEVDKTVIEKLADPLTHMIRNAVDHGLENPEKRIENSKDEEGIIKLSASHRSGKIIIEICDDGAGINRERVKNIAIEKNLIPEDATLSDSEIDNLLFMPGFSTAKEVSNLSGRGVGMDVVKRSIQELGGRIAISSEPGKGSTFTVSLPLTLAVLDGMVVRVADQTLIVPLTAVYETLKVTPSDIHGIGVEDKVISVRGEFLPIIDIGYNLGYRESFADIKDGVVLTVETGDGDRSALLVDMIKDQRQVVIKSLEDNYGHVEGIAAATILGDGRIALILDVDAVVNNAGFNNHPYLETPVAAAG